MSYKLRACPMCGGNEIDVRTRKVTIIECKSCGLMMFDRRDGVERNAIAAWNRRADDRKPITTDPCNGMNCGCTDGVSHSPECLAQTAATYAGGYFVKAGVVVDDLDIPGLKCAAQAMTPIMRNWIMRVLDAFESASAAPQPAPATGDDIPDPHNGVEAVIACLGDDAATLREDYPEIADNMDRAAELLAAHHSQPLDMVSTGDEPTPAMYEAAQKILFPIGGEGDMAPLNTTEIRRLWLAMTASAAHRRGNEWQASTPEQLGELLDKIAPPTDEREAFKKCMRAFGIASDDYHAWVGWQTSAHHRRDAYSVPLVRYRINLADGTDSADPDGGYFRDTDVAAMMARNELHMDQVMRERDGVHDKADQLADAIAEYLGVEIGEHSNLNCPWTNALEHIGAAHRREDQRGSTANGGDDERARSEVGAVSGQASVSGDSADTSGDIGCDCVPVAKVVGADDYGPRLEWSTHWADLIGRDLYAAMQRTAAPAHQKAHAPRWAFPDRDPSKPAEQQGLFHKFDVRRTDGSSEPGGKHEGCAYFVLDLDHDPHARAALDAYAQSVEATHPILAADIRNVASGAAPAHGESRGMREGGEG